MKRLLFATCCALLASAGTSLGADLPRPAYKAPPLAPEYIAPFTWTGFYHRYQRRLRLGQSRCLQFGRQLHDRQPGRLADRRDRRLQPTKPAFGSGALRAISTTPSSKATPRTPPPAAQARARSRTPGSRPRARASATPAGTLHALHHRRRRFRRGEGRHRRPAASSTDTTIGWTAGAGVEYAFLGNWSAKLEYLYADLGTATCDASICGVDTDIKPKINIVRAGLNYRF